MLTLQYRATDGLIGNPICILVALHNWNSQIEQTFVHAYSLACRTHTIRSGNTNQRGTVSANFNMQIHTKVGTCSLVIQSSSNSHLTLTGWLILLIHKLPVYIDSNWILRILRLILLTQWWFVQNTFLDILHLESSEKEKSYEILLRVEQSDRQFWQWRHPPRPWSKVSMQPTVSGYRKMNCKIPRAFNPPWRGRFGGLISRNVPCQKPAASLFSSYGK